MAPHEQLIDRKRLLAEFDLLTEENVARLLNIDVKTLKNRPRTQQPSFSKVGRARLYSKQAVLDFLAATAVQSGTSLRVSKPVPRGRKAERPTA